MSYSTPAMVRMALFPTGDGGLPDPPSNTPADLTDAQIADAINEADSTIDSMIGRYYNVPVAVVISGDEVQGDGAPDGAIPHPVDYWSRNIAAYSAALSFRAGQDFPDTDPIARRYNATMQALTLVSQGKATLQLPDNNSTNAAAGAGKPVNPYIGDLFDPCDFNLVPINPAWPLWPDQPFGVTSW